MSRPLAKKTSAGRRRDHLHLPEGAPRLAAGLVEAFARIVGYACDCRALQATNPAKAIHEFRKAVRRTRALVKLVRPITGERVYRCLNDQLRRALAPTSALRDADVLHDLVVEQERTEETAEQLDALQELLARDREAHREGRVEEALAAGVALLRPLPGRFARVLPWGLDEEDLRQALALSYERARRRFKRVRKRPGDHAAIHDWRKRVKELRYQLELLGGRQAGPVQELHQAFAGLAEELGLITDQVALHHLVTARRRDLAGHRPDRLLQRLEASIEATAGEVARERRVLFQQRPHLFARRAVAGIG